MFEQSEAIIFGKWLVHEVLKLKLKTNTSRIL